MTDIVLSVDQTAVLHSVERWLKRGDFRREPFFYLAGYAGTGKTSVAEKLVEGRRAVFAAYTGKAAEVMQRNGCEGATTIHRLIYATAGGENDPAVKALRDEISALSRRTPPPREELRAATAKIAAIRRAASSMRFRLNRTSPVADADIVVIDEVSMVPEDMARDLLSFGKPILVLGDPMQLPPVNGPGFFTARQPHALLEKVHRQKDGSGVLDLATMIRGGRLPSTGSYGNSVVIDRAKLGLGIEIATMRQADQVLVGRNDTRRAYNEIMRGPTAPVLPIRGDRLVCLRNNHELGFFNGSTATAFDDAIEHGNAVEVFVTKDGSHVPDLVRIDRAAIAGGGAGDDLDLIAFDYAFALTVHKAQGSQWSRVMVFDESAVARKDALSWLYTAVTRAQDQVVLVVNL